jgi:hypothetical protein
MNRITPARALGLSGFLVLALSSVGASGEVAREGTWPAEEPKVTLSVDHLPRSEAVKRLADKAGWSVVIEAPSSAPIDVHVKDQPADKVLEILLSDGRYVAKRDGSLISIAKAGETAATPEAPASASAPPPAPAAPIPSAEPPPSAAPAPPVAKTKSTSDDEEANESARASGKDADDRVVTGGSTRVEANETVHDLVVMGGSAEVLGKVTGDVVVMGGSAKVHDGAEVDGDATVLGGSLDIADGAKFHGKVDTLGGSVHRGHDGNVRLSFGAGRHSRGLMGVLSDIGGAITRTALLFVFGTVLLALGTRRMEAMQGEVAARPMRTFALGIVGSIAFGLAFIAVCVTIIGIPIAVIALLFGVFGTYAGICAALATAGGALAHHRTKSPYVHLAIGCVLFLLLSSIPWIGGFITALVVFLGIGSLIATRGAGFLTRRASQNGGPYRTAAA